jgi:uncharacterized protein (TIGR02611 family)
VDREKLHHSWKLLPHPIRWVVVATFGGTLLLLGIIFLVLPGPGLPLVILGLAILASEFAWAQYMLNQVRQRSQAVAQKTKERLKQKKKTD